MSGKGGGWGRSGHRGGPWEERGGGERRGGRREERGGGRGERGPWEHRAGGGREWEGRGGGRGRGRGYRQGLRLPPLPENIERALEQSGQRRGQVLCNAWTMQLDGSVQAWGYPLSIKESGTERPVEERSERRKILAELLKALTGVQAAPGSERPRRILTRGAQHSELLRWVIVYSERIRRLIRDEPRREVAVRNGDVAAKTYYVTFGEERPLTGGDWRFYFIAALMSTLEAASYQRALGQSQYLKLDTRTLRTDMQIHGLDAVLVQSDKTWLIKMSRHDRKLEPGFLEDRLREMDHQRAQDTYRNRLCVAVHRGNVYKILNITDETADRKNFERAGKTVTVAQYFKDAYNENVDGKQIIEVQQLRGGARICYLPANLLRLLAQVPPPTAGSRQMVRPKSAQETLIECTELMSDILRTPAVKDQMAELKLRIGEDDLPLNVQEYIIDLKKLMGDVRSYGEPRISWGSLERSSQQGTAVDLSPDFRTRLCQNLVLRHKVPLESHWLLLICSGHRQHSGTRVEEAVKNTIELTRHKIRYRNQLTVEMEAPSVCEHFLMNEADWRKGRVETTKRKLRDLLNTLRYGLRGALVVLAYDSDEVNNRVRVAAKQVSVQLDFPIQCCKFQTLQSFKNRGGDDKSMNMWWNVYVQFQAKITDDALHSGVPWAADDLLAPITEDEKSTWEVTRAIGIAANSFGPPNSRHAVVGIVAGRNVAHTQFMSHIGASPPAHFRAGVVKDMARHFQIFWKKFCKHLKMKEQESRVYKVPPAHLLIYRSAPSGSSQIKEILAHEVAAIRGIIDAELGKFEFSAERNELVLEHPMAAAFPEALFDLALLTCPAASVAQFEKKSEELGLHAALSGIHVVCQGAAADSEGRHIIRFPVPNGRVPWLRRPGPLIGKYTFPEPEALTLVPADAGGVALKLPDSHPVIKYTRSNSRWLALILMDLTPTAEEEITTESPVALIVFPFDDIPPKFKVRGCQLAPGGTLYLRRVTITQIVQRVHLNVLVNPHRPASPMRFFVKGKEAVQGLAVGSYIDSGPIIPVAPDTDTPEEKFLIGTADPTKGSPSASEFHIITNESDWSRHYLAVVSFKMCHMYYNWAGTVKHPHLLQMALAIVRQHQLYIASESGYGLDSEFAFEEQPSQKREESPEEGEEPEASEKLQKRRQEGGYVARFGSGEASEGPDDAAEREAGQRNLQELKASLENQDSVLMTTAFML